MLTTPIWTAELDQAYTNFGASVASAGDVNADGYDDVLVGAPLYDGGEEDEGSASLYLGSAAGLSTAVAWTAESDQGNARLGYSVASAGDVNGDGYDDVVAGAAYYDNGEAEEGRASLYLGSAAGLSTTAWTAEPDQGYARFGISVASAGDVNADGYDDVIVGSSDYDHGEEDEGRAWLYLGSAAGLSTVAAWTAEPDEVLAHFGSSVASAGDVNGDGYDDVIVGAYNSNQGQINEGRAWLYLGSAAGLSTTAAWTAESDQKWANFGYSVASAGDVNADGYADVIVGAPFYNKGESAEGRVWLYLGSAAGLSTVAACTLEPDQPGAYLGSSVASAGDVNADGYDDVIVGAYGYDNGEEREGAAFLYLGSAAGLSTAVAWTAESDQDDARLGTSVASAGDVNGDGYADVVVGAPGYVWGQPGKGGAFLYEGACSEAVFYADLDEDGLGDPDDSVTACTAPSGYVANADDLCPVGVCDTGAGESGPETDTADLTDAASPDTVEEAGGCGRDSGGAGWSLGPLAALLVRRRRRSA